MNEAWLVYDSSKQGGDRFTLVYSKNAAEHAVAHSHSNEIEVYVFTTGDRPSQKWQPYVPSSAIVLEEVSL